MEGLAEGEELASNILHLRRGSGACTAAAAPGHVPGPITATTTGAGLCWCATAAAPQLLRFRQNEAAISRLFCVTRHGGERGLGLIVRRSCGLLRLSRTSHLVIAILTAPAG